MFFSYSTTFFFLPVQCFFSLGPRFRHYTFLFKSSTFLFYKKQRKLQQQPYSTEYLLENPEVFLEVLTQQIALRRQNEQLKLTAAKYEGQMDTDGLYKIGEIAKELSIGARTLNKFLHDCRVQYLPSGSKTWRLYSEYEKDGLAVPRIITLNNGRELVLLVWTPKGRDFIFDLVDRELPDWYVG